MKPSAASERRWLFAIRPHSRWLSRWTWQSAAELLGPPPAEPPSPSPALDLGPLDLDDLVAAIDAAQPKLPLSSDADEHDQGSWDPSLLASLGRTLLSRSAEAEQDELLRRAADNLRQQLAGNIVTYVVNRNLNVSNHCIKHCSFCAFRRDAGDPGAYWLSEADLQQKAAEALEAGATELCIQGGLNPAATVAGSQLAYAERLLGLLHAGGTGVAPACIFAPGAALFRPARRAAPRSGAGAAASGWPGIGAGYGGRGAQ